MCNCVHRQNASSIMTVSLLSLLEFFLLIIPISLNNGEPEGLLNVQVPFISVQGSFNKCPMFL